MHSKHWECGVTVFKQCKHSSITLYKLHLSWTNGMGGSRRWGRGRGGGWGEGLSRESQKIIAIKTCDVATKYNWRFQNWMIFYLSNWEYHTLRSWTVLNLTTVFIWFYNLLHNHILVFGDKFLKVLVWFYIQSYKTFAFYQIRSKFPNANNSMNSLVTKLFWNLRNAFLSLTDGSWGWVLTRRDG